MGQHVMISDQISTRNNSLWFPSIVSIHQYLQCLQLLLHKISHSHSRIYIYQKLPKTIIPVLELNYTLGVGAAKFSHNLLIPLCVHMKQNVSDLSVTNLKARCPLYTHPMNIFHAVEGIDQIMKP